MYNYIYIDIVYTYYMYKHYYMHIIYMCILYVCVYIYIYAGMHLPPTKGMACSLWVYLLRKIKVTM